MRRAALPLLLSLLVPGGVAPGGAGQTTAPPAPTAAWGDSLYPTLGQAGLDVQHYDLALTVPTPGTPTLSANVTLTAHATRDLPLLSLDFTGPAVTRATWNGQSLPFTHDRARGKLLLRRALPRGAATTVTLHYQGEPQGLPDPVLPLRVGWQSVPGAAGAPGANFAFSEPDGTRSFLPVNDHPADPATFTVHLTVPQALTAVASGVQTSDHPAPGQRHTVTFEQRQPIPTYALALHVGPLERVTVPPAPAAPGRTVTRADYFPPGVPDTVRAPYRRTNEMLRTLQDWFGPYPFETLGAVVVTPALPALETATLSTMPVRSSTDRVVVHELAHQWFGNAVPLADWADVWLNEGFATYAELLWAQAQGQDGQSVANTWYEQLRARGTRPLVARTQEEMFDLSAYQRGALALHALRAQVGDPAFRGFLRAYAAARTARPTRTADLLRLTRTRLGDAAERTLREWIEQPELPPRPEVLGGPVH
ncbi:M1 family metallopeptidase [Deinococcus taeanensis]|uniref:M1 family metallopeptidase n=1 Tax=Deinococcus taeanensis TaxID=2737050 RepID=UPI001CDCCAD2|nr:M1 family metallopeptidase [Deinococcus taeanensis]UBV43341.1 M1 family metallopeptidase [Deinococcus taeanensis]